MDSDETERQLATMRREWCDMFARMAERRRTRDTDQ